MVRYCPNCGNEVAEDDKFCIKCGKSLAVGNENNKSSIDSKSFKHGVIKWLLQLTIFFSVSIIVAVHPYFREVPSNRLFLLLVIGFILGSIYMYIDKLKL